MTEHIGSFAFRKIVRLQIWDNPSRLAVGVEDPQTSVVFSGRYDINEADRWTSRCAERLQLEIRKAFIEAGTYTKLLKQRIKKFLVLFCFVLCYSFFLTNGLRGGGHFSHNPHSYENKFHCQSNLDSMLTSQNIFLSKIHGLCWSLTDLASTHLLSDWRKLWMSRCPLVCRRAGYLSSWSPISGSQTRTTSAGRPSASGRRCKQTVETWPFYDMSSDCSLYHSHGGAAALSDQSMSHHQWR